MNQELRDAVAAVEGARNLYRALGTLEKALNQALLLDNLVAEREKQAAGLAEKLAARKGELDALDKAHEKRVAALEDSYRQREAALLEQLGRDEKAREEQLSRSAALYEDLAGKRVASLAALNVEVAKLAKQREELAASVAVLSEEDAALRARLSKVLG